MTNISKLNALKPSLSTRRVGNNNPEFTWLKCLKVKYWSNPFFCAKAIKKMGYY